ncbi:MAG: Fe-S cluster biogenesis protein NfuA [Salibacteraceae bacterium]|jgi:Fe-S cluster biogenesis protein NfuA
MAKHEEIKQRIINALAQVRPYLLEDGGDVELIGLSPELVAKIELKGNCTSCSMNSMTFKNGIIDSIRTAVPEVTDIEAVNFVVIDPKI